MSTDAILTGLGLVIVLAIGCQLIAARFRLPAIVLLLPAGFIAGAITSDVHPSNLFGATFQPLVSLGVGLILFEAGLRLRLDELRGGVRSVVLRLISVGSAITLVGVALSVKLLFGLDWGVSVVLGAILVVSGPTVVLPLLAFVRPSDRVRAVLKWEGTLIDPIGALLGVVAFQAVQHGATGGRPFHPGELTISLVTGAAIGAIGAGILAVMLGALQGSTPRHGLPAALMMVAGIVVGADVLREDSGLVAATFMGATLANQNRLDVSRILEFQGTIVSLLIGILFVLISASVSPSDVRAVLPDGIWLIAIMVLILRPLVIALGALGSDLTVSERAFAAWMAPRGIVAGATASSFALGLGQAGVAGASRILPIAFVAIFGTVVLYGLTASPLARLLDVAGAGRATVLIVGGHRWARALAQALTRVGIKVRIWTDRLDEQAAAREIGIPVSRVPLGVDVVGREAELEEVSDVLVMTRSDEFNALAGYELRQELGNHRVYRLAHRADELDRAPEYTEGEILFDAALTFDEMRRRFERGAQVVDLPAEYQPAGRRDGLTPLFCLHGDGRLEIATATRALTGRTGDRIVFLADSGLGTGSRPTSP
jgi:NhaP-type Na+/H+ or K+/H+ antiporter